MCMKNKYIKSFLESTQSDDIDETYIKTIEFEGEKLTLHKVADNPMKTQLYLDTLDGESYIDINKILPTNMLVDAVWVEVGGTEEKVADTLDILKKTSKTTSNGHSKYVMYNIVG